MFASQATVSVPAYKEVVLAIQQILSLARPLHLAIANILLDC